MTHPRFRLLALLLALLASRAAGAAPPTTAPAPAPEAERWYTLLLGGQPAGWMHLSITRQGDRIESLDETKLALKREQLTLEIQTSQRVVETAAGKPLEASATMKMGALATTQRLVFKPDGSAELTTEQAGQTQRKTLTKADFGDKPWLTPMAAHRYVQEQLAKGVKQLQYRALNLTLGPTPMDVLLVAHGPEKVEVAGKVVPALAVTETVMNVAAKQWLDDQGFPVKMTSNVAGLELVMLAADRELAQAKLNPPEILAASLIKPDKPIAQPRQARTAVFQLRLSPPPAGQPDAPLDLPRAGYQRVSWGDKQTATVVVDLSSPVNPEQDLPTDAHRKASAALNSDDPKVRELMTQALKDLPASATPAAKAEALRRFAHRFIKTKDLSVGFATASEVARTAEGDCTEHGMLLAALLRAAGIPSRVVSGVVYVERFAGGTNIFGYHMWTQAWLPGEGNPGGAGGRWVDVDATLDDAQPFDATHIALAHSAMADAVVSNDLVKMAAVMGRLTIRVVSVQPAGK